jgi:pimeloyl-ACP methyl ester carboxylesterase/predicted glycosyltransferase
MTGTAASSREPMRARYPDDTGYVERDGVRVYYEVQGAGEATVLLLPTWSIVHSRIWKMQVPYLARHCRVVTFDGRGNGRSDRPTAPSDYGARVTAADAVGVLAATATARAFVVGFSLGAHAALVLAGEHPELVDGVAFIGPAVPLGTQGARATAAASFDEPRESYDGWAKFNRHYWLAHYGAFLEFFFGQVFTEPHSTKQIEDCVAWGLDTSPETLIAIQEAGPLEEGETRDLARRVKCPVLVLHGTGDQIRTPASGAALAELCSGTLVSLEGSGHAPHARDPVRVNLLLRDLIAPPSSPPHWIRPRARPRRALYISSPIGLGHARRDVAIAGELRRRVPGLEIDWLAQHPVTAFLEARGERIHPASAELAGESAHIEAESGEHELHAFQAIRRMDEILAANFMVFHDVVREEAYDLWIGDEAWELDHFLHENPELKTAPFAWVTDFVGWLPTDEGGDAEAALTADYNAEMLEHIARHPRLRDRAVFVGEPDDIVPDSFGPGLPPIREWTERHYRFSGYITGFDAAGLGSDRATLRSELGYAPEDRVCIVSAGGSGVGVPLMRRAVESFPAAAALVPGLRMIIVCGPRIDTASLPAADGGELRAYEPDLHRHLAACDLAIVHGGLTTTMELTAARRPFLYFPLGRHFEQRRHVRYRLERYRAGRCLEFNSCDAQRLAEVIAREIGRDVDYLPVRADGAARAATVIAELLPR